MPPPLLKKTSDDWGVLEIRGEHHVPDYDPKVVGRGMPENKYRREVLGDWSATMGKVAYPEFGPIHKATEPLSWVPAKPILVGWDFGGTAWSGTPAATIAQLNPLGQCLVYQGIMPEEDEAVGIYDFAGWVRDYLRDEFAEPAGLVLGDLKLIHWGDPAGDYRPPNTQTTGKRMEARSCYEIIQKGLRIQRAEDERGEPVWEEKPGYGWRIRRGEVTLTKRMEMMRMRLQMLVHGGLPAIVLDPGATNIISAFEGGYHYHQRSDGRFDLDPMKNHASHVMNSLEYLVSRLHLSENVETDRGSRHHQQSSARGTGRRLV